MWKKIKEKYLAFKNRNLCKDCKWNNGNLTCHLKKCSTGLEGFINITDRKWCHNYSRRNKWKY